MRLQWKSKFRFSRYKTRPRFCISALVCGDADAAGLGHTRWEPCSAAQWSWTTVSFVCQRKWGRVCGQVLLLEPWEAYHWHLLGRGRQCCSVCTIPRHGIVSPKCRASAVETRLKSIPSGRHTCKLYELSPRSSLASLGFHSWSLVWIWTAGWNP